MCKIHVYIYIYAYIDRYRISVCVILHDIVILHIEDIYTQIVRNRLLYLSISCIAATAQPEGAISIPSFNTSTAAKASC